MFRILLECAIVVVYPALSSVYTCEESHASKNEYDGACIRMRLLNFLMVMRVMEELMVVRLLIVDVGVVDEVPNCSMGGVDLF